MSRIGKLPVNIPDGVEVKIQGSDIVVKGPKGTLSQRMLKDIKFEIKDGQVLCTPENEDRKTRAAWGLSRVLIYNMVTGVSAGFKKELSIVGVGYRAEMKGKNLTIHIGYSHPILVFPREGIEFAVESPTKIIVSGIDKQLVGQVAADIREVRPPEPYKGKGIRYADEQVQRKAGKAGAK
ncbi:MAG: 50S ribosomal protein L6 [Chitinispirillaceae bacterium]